MKGQMTIIGMIVLMIAFIVLLVVVLPILQPFIDAYEGGEADTMIVRLIPFFMVLGLVVSGILFYMMPRYEQPPVR